MSVQCLFLVSVFHSKGRLCVMHRKAQIVGLWLRSPLEIFPFAVYFSFEDIVILDALQKHVAASGSKASHTRKVNSKNLWQLLLPVLWQDSCCRG